jgi:hypothetical protein
LLNLDAIKQKKEEMANKVLQATKDNNPEGFAEAFTQYTDLLQEMVMAEAKGLIQSFDKEVLMGRGVRTLTSQETQYYENVIEAMKSGNPKQALSTIDEALPTTVIDSIMEDIVEEHPLLDEISFQNTGILTEIIVSTLDGRFKGVWGALNSEITKELAAGLTKIELAKKKLSAFIPISKPMLEIGPVWIDRYVRAILLEAINNGLEDSIINGTGVDQPIGMTKDPNGLFHATEGYPDLTPVPLTEVTPATYGAVIGGMAEGRNGLYRIISEVLLICNPVDYYTKVMPAVMFQMADGTWVSRWPFPTKVIQSVYVESGKAVIGIGKRYFFGLGTAKEGKIEYSDEYAFLDDDRYYLTKLYGEGKPLDNTSFKVLDISALKPVDLRVLVANWPDDSDPVEVNNVSDARLYSLAIGALTLSPTFDRDVNSYTAATTNATNAINVTPLNADATVEILNGATPVANGDPATWAEGENTVTITVTINGQSEVYTVVVTKS